MISNKFINISIFIVITFSTNSCDFLVEPNIWIGDDRFSPLNIKWNQTNSIVCYGTSITNGKPSGSGIITVVPPPPTPPDSSYPKLLNDKLKIKVINKGYWGAKIDYAKSIFIDSILSQNPVLILLEFGANEFLQNVDVTITEIKLDSLITMIKSFNLEIVLLSFYNPDMLTHTQSNHFLYNRKELADKYFEMYKRLTKKHKILMDDYILRNIWGRPDLMSSDQIHPNNKGNSILRDNILSSFHNTFSINRMIK